MAPSGSQLEVGREAYRRHAWREAYQALSAADQESPLQGEDARWLAWSAILTGHDEEMLQVAERIYQCECDAGDPLMAARVAFWAAMRLFALGEPGRGSGWLARAGRIVEGHEGECAERGYLWLARIRQHLAAGAFTEARELAERAVAVGEQFADTDLVALARTLQGQALAYGGRTDDGVALFDEVLVGAAAGQLSPIVTGMVYCSAIAACERVYALDRAREWTEGLSRWWDSQPQLVSFTSSCLVHRARVLALGGEWTDSFEEARRACGERSVEVDRDARADAYYQAGEIHRLRGEASEAEAAYRRASELGRDPQPGLALLRVNQGRLDAAIGAIRRVLASTPELLPRARFLPACVEIMLAAGEIEEAEEAAAELTKLAGELDNPIVQALSDEAHGAVRMAAGDPAAAVAPLGRALSTWQGVGAPYLAARVRVVLARACAALGDPDGASMARQEARAVFQELGAAPDLERLEGSDTESRAQTPSHGLTPRELEVLRLVATGQTNRAIAAELGVSQKTVDRHVSNIFTKLDVPSRAAATAYAYENGLV